MAAQRVGACRAITVACLYHTGYYSTSKTRAKARGAERYLGELSHRPWNHTDTCCPIAIPGSFSLARAGTRA